MDQRIEIAILLISDDLRHKTTVAELAKHLNLSLSRLRHLFKAETGMSPGQYFKDLRLQKAKELLETTFLSVKQIMSDIGVSDRGRFAQDFQKAYGLKPALYRAQLMATPFGEREADQIPGK